MDFFIWSLPKEWRPKRIVIGEGKYSNTLSSDNLIDSLIFYEKDLAIEKGDENQKKSIPWKLQDLRAIKKPTFKMMILQWLP